MAYDKNRNNRIFYMATFVKNLGWGVHVLGPQNETARKPTAVIAHPSTHWVMPTVTYFKSGLSPNSHDFSATIYHSVSVFLLNTSQMAILVNYVSRKCC